MRQIPSQTSMQTQTPKFLPKRPYHLSNPFRIFSRKVRCKSCETPSLVIVRRHAHSFRSMGCTVSVAPFTAVSPHMGNYASFFRICKLQWCVLFQMASWRMGLLHFDVVATSCVRSSLSKWFRATIINLCCLGNYRYEGKNCNTYFIVIDNRAQE